MPLHTECGSGRMLATGPDGEKSTKKNSTSSEEKTNVTPEMENFEFSQRRVSCKTTTVRNRAHNGQRDFFRDLRTGLRAHTCNEPLFAKIAVPGTYGVAYKSDVKIRFDDFNPPLRMKTVEHYL